jgi:hypothetical protein
MLEGTDLMSAYQTMSTPDMEMEGSVPQANMQQANMQQANMQQANMQQANMQQAQMSQAQMSQAQMSQAQMSQVESQIQQVKKHTQIHEAIKSSSDQSINALVAELNKKKKEEEPPSYFDRLFGKKKELLRLLQMALIVTLGISLHFLIDFYIKKYISDNEISFERQLIIRIIYPLAVIFLLWNLRVFIK